MLPLKIIVTALLVILLSVGTVEVSLATDLDLAEIQKAAEQGDSVAQFKLATYYMYGSKGIQKDDANAFKWFLKAAEQGVARAQFWVGFMYDFGKGIKEDKAKAFEWYLKAAQNGEAEACQSLGFLYKHGSDVVPKDETKSIEFYQKALTIFRKSAEQGNVWGYTGLAFMYENGQGVTANEVEVEKWLNKAAEQGDMDSQYRLVGIYRKRNMPEKDITAILLKWYQEDANKRGDARAQSGLGDMYYFGQGVEQNYYTAAYWYKKAVDQNYAAAQYSLGLMHLDGQGVILDRQMGCNLLRASAEQGYRSAIEAYNDLCAVK